MSKVPGNFFRSTILREKRIFRDRIGNLVIIEQLILLIIIKLGTKNEKNGELVEKLDLWFLVWAFSYPMVHPRF